jgi:putative tricarboxylic transport membrane protein
VRGVRNAGRFLLFVALGVAALVASACATSGGGGAGEEYPSGAVRLVAPAEPGSGWDVTARTVADVLEKEKLIDHPLPVENRTGATGAVWQSQMVNDYKGEDDVIAVTSTPIMSNYLRGDSDYEYTDVTMIVRFITEYYMVAVAADSEYQNLEDLLDAVKENPGEVPIGAAGDDRLPFALLVQAAGGNPEEINFVAYEGGGEQTAALLNGDIDAAMAGVSEFRGQLMSGDLRGLAVLKDERLDPPLDDMPTAPEEGYDVTLDNWRGLYGPPDMSEEAVTYWENTIQKMVETEEWKKAAEKNQWDTTYMKDEEMRAYLKKTYGEIRKAMEATGEIQQ